MDRYGQAKEFERYSLLIGTKRGKRTERSVPMDGWMDGRKEGRREEGRVLEKAADIEESRQRGKAGKAVERHRPTIEADRF